MTIDWDDRLIDLAEQIATWSKDPRTKVGAVIVDSDRRIISTGYNGFPRGVYDDPELLNNRDDKLKRIIHAEANAIISARCDLTGTHMYSTLTPCSQCAGFIIQSGISRVYTPRFNLDHFAASPFSMWAEDFKIAKSMLKQAKIQCETVHQTPTIP